MKADTFGVRQNPEAAITMFTAEESKAYRESGGEVGFYSTPPCKFEVAMMNFAEGLVLEENSVFKNREPGPLPYWKPIKCKPPVVRDICWKMRYRFWFWLTRLRFRLKGWPV